MINKILEARRLAAVNTPLIHCITNPISINDCANFTLSTGAKPIMAEHPEEVREITLSSDALALNIANITDARMKSMLTSAKAANEKGIPVIIDAVGTACSSFRLKYIKELLGETKVSVIKGNIAEIKALMGVKADAIGIDARQESADMPKDAETVTRLAEKYNCTAMASGKTDIIGNGKKTVYIKNGRREMSLVTGTGCILNILSAVYMSQSDALTGCTAAAVILGICGELADSTKGMGSYRINMLDKLYTLTNDEIIKYAKIEIL